ncbi:MAG: hypothetical protein JSW67_12510 [Candidatus Latescibacterota bacterium]|nr:MAG: hypothetical protein JSW67_12510 [Candidatus Latescibacterota bacterium]
MRNAPLRCVGTAVFCVGASVVLQNADLVHAGRLPRYGGHLRIELAELPTDLDPTRLNGDDAALVAACVYEGLTRQAGAGPGLAHGWIHDEQARRWVFHLRSGVQFHDGTACDADAVSESLHRLSDPRVSEHAWILRELVGWDDFSSGATQQIEGIYVVSANEIELHFRSPLPDLPARLALPAAGIAHWQGLVPSGTGPFRAVGAVGNALRLLAFDRHHRGRPYLDGVDFIAASATDDLALLDGAALMQRADPLARPAVGQVRVRVPTARLGVALLHPRSRALEGMEVRRRLAEGFDRGVFVRATLSGDGEAALGLAPSRKRSTPRMEEAEGDLLQRPRQQVRIVTASSEPVLQKLGERLQVHLFALGLDARLDVLDSPRYAEALRTSRYDIVLLGWSPPLPERSAAAFDASSLASSADGARVRSILSSLVAPILGPHMPPRWRDLLEGRETASESALLESGQLIPLIFFHDQWRAVDRVVDVHPSHTDLGVAGAHLQPMRP